MCYSTVVGIALIFTAPFCVWSLQMHLHPQLEMGIAPTVRCVKVICISSVFISFTKWSRSSWFVLLNHFEWCRGGGFGPHYNRQRNKSIHWLLLKESQGSLIGGKVLMTIIGSLLVSARWQVFACCVNSWRLCPWCKWICCSTFWGIVAWWLISLTLIW